MDCTQDATFSNTKHLLKLLLIINMDNFILFINFTVYA